MRSSDDILGRTSDYETGVRIGHLLDSFGIEYRKKGNGNFFYVVCPFHGGTSKSLWIHKGGRKIRCHKCGKEGSWDDYAKAKGFPRLKSEGPGVGGKSYLRDRIKSQSYQSSDTIAEIKLPRGKRWKGRWRDLSPGFLRFIPALEWYDRRSGYDRILFPITHENKIVGYTAGRDPSGEYEPSDPKYRTSKMLPTERIWFMYDQVDPVEILLITEGPYDCLRLLQYKIPTVGCMGATNWSSEKTDSLLMRPNLRHILVASDGDKGGDDMWDLARDELDGQIKLSRIKVPRGEDPGSLPRKWINRLRADLIEDTVWNGKYRLNSIDL